MLAKEHKLQVSGNSALGITKQAILNSSLAWNFQETVSPYLTK
jgi:hypothetical protein